MLSKMRNLSKLAALAALLLAGCQTTSTIKEPERTQYYAYCIMNGLHATTCQCMEAKAVKDTGLTGIEEASPEDQQRFLNSLNSYVKECNEATQKLLEGAE